MYYVAAGAGRTISAMCTVWLLLIWYTYTRTYAHVYIYSMAYTVIYIEGGLLVSSVLWCVPVYVYAISDIHTMTVSVVYTGQVGGGVL